MERRRKSRIRCRIPCDVSAGGKTVEVRVRNLSEGGLALEAPPALADEGDSLSLTLKPPGRPPIEIVALLWHTRALRSRRGAAAVAQVGLVLSEAGDDYFALVDGLGGRSPTAQTRGSQTAPDPGSGHRYAVRVAQSGSPRTRRILVRAADTEAARERAVEETGPGWSVVEIVSAQGA